MGPGWSHSFAYSAKTDSDGFQGYGQDSPISGAAAITATYVLKEMLTQADNAHPLTQMVIGVQAERWLMDQLTNNIVAVAQPKQVETFVKLPDGSYKEPLGSSGSLTASAGLFTYSTASKAKLAFNSLGNIATWTSPAGPVVTFTYNGSNQLSSVSNGMGRTLTLSYTGGSITGVTDGARSVGYTYATDGSGNLTQFTDAASNATTYSYVAGLPGLLAKIFYPSFPTTAYVTNTYDTFDRVRTQADADSNLWTFYFAGSRSETDDPTGAAQVYYLNAGGTPLVSIDALGRQTINSYDGIGRLASTILPEGNVLSFAYDNSYSSAAVRSQNVLSVTQTAKPGSPLSPIVQSFTYDTGCADKVKTATDPKGNVTTSIYNQTTCTLSEVDQPVVGGATPKTVFSYNGRGQVLTKTDPVGKVTTFAYHSGTEELLSVTDDSAPGHFAIQTQYAYDGAAYDGAPANAIGNVTSTTDPNGKVTTANYDALRRTTQVTGPAATGAVTKTSYNPDGLVTQVQRATGNATAPWQTSSATWSAAGKQLTATDPNGNVTTYTYDALERLTSVTDAANRVTTFGYDLLGRQTSVTNSGIQAAPLLAYTYTPNGKRQTLTDANTNKTTYVYDGLDRLAQTQFPSATPHAGTSDPSNYEAVTSYDANGNPLTVRKRDGTVITLSYDSLNRPTSKAYPGNVGNISMTFDLDGRMLSAVNGTSSSTVTYVYDTAGRLRTETTNGRTLTYGYDQAGNRTSESWPDAFAVAYGYDSLNRMTTVTETATSVVLATYSWDPLSRRTGLSRANGASTAWGYDAGSRLTSLAHTMPAVSASASLTLGFAYTAADQLQTRTARAADPGGSRRQGGHSTTRTDGGGVTGQIPRRQ